jgi:hypothetical protein
MALVYMGCLIILYQTGPRVRKEIKKDIPKYFQQAERWLRDPEYYAKKK